MFRKSLSESLGRIFGIDKVSFDLPAEDAQEQEGLFVKVDKVVSRIDKGVAVARVSGSFAVFAQQAKMPFGYFSKRIAAASQEDTTSFFFYNLEQNERYYVNLVERSCSFIYFWRGQYDPDAGQITEVNLSLTEG